MGVQTGVGLFVASEQMAPGWVRRSMVLHDEQSLLLLTHPPASNLKAYRFVRGPLELRLQATFVGFVGWEFLGWRHHQLERHF
jgi:hypothetical protein